MEIWSFCNSKGGTGKTTCVTNIAHSLALKGYRVCVVDADPQGSLRDWQDISGWDTFPVIGLDRGQSLRLLRKTFTQDSYDYVLVDTPGKAEGITGVAISISDKVIIPVQPSPYDVWATKDVVDLVKARQEIADGKPAAIFLISRAIPNTNIGKEVFDVLSEYGVSVLKNHTSQRVIYPASASEGKTVLKSKNKDAIAEINNIAEEISSLITIVEAV